MGKDKKELNNISLRNYFAGQVLNGLLANAHLQKGFLGDINIKVSEATSAQHYHAMISYKFADAMIKQSKKDE